MARKLNLAQLNALNSANEETKDMNTSNELILTESELAEQARIAAEEAAELARIAEDRRIADEEALFDAAHDLAHAENDAMIDADLIARARAIIEGAEMIIAKELASIEAAKAELARIALKSNAGSLAYRIANSKSICEALRAAAKDWKGDRKSFIEAAGAEGINAGTAATQWGHGRKA